MTAMTNTVLMGVLKLTIVGGVAIYGGLVLMSYRTDGSRASLQFVPNDLARTIQRLLVWLGVWVVAATLRVARGIFGSLSEASAEVGEWYLSRRKAEVQAAVRSKFMI